MPKKSGAVQFSDRGLPEADIARIVNLGLPQDLWRIEATRYDPKAPGLANGPTPFERPVLERLRRRRFAQHNLDIEVRYVDKERMRCALLEGPLAPIGSGSFQRAPEATCSQRG